jgi:hypothetical protein
MQREYPRIEATLAKHGYWNVLTISPKLLYLNTSDYVMGLLHYKIGFRAAHLGKDDWKRVCMGPGRTWPIMNPKFAHLIPAFKTLQICGFSSRKELYGSIALTEVCDYLGRGHDRKCASKL